MLRRISWFLAAVLTVAALTMAVTTSLTRAEGNAVPGLDAFWLQSSIQGDLFEIQGGQLAQQEGTTQGVKDFGARLVADHTQSMNDAVALARRLGVEVPDQPTPTQQWQLQVLQTFSGDTFEQQYLALEVADHQQDIEETQTEIEQGMTPDIQAEAQKDLPVLQEHLSIAQQLQSGGTPVPAGATPVSATGS